MTWGTRETSKDSLFESGSRQERDNFERRLRARGLSLLVLLLVINACVITFVTMFDSHREFLLMCSFIIFGTTVVQAIISVFFFIWYNIVRFCRLIKYIFCCMCCRRDPDDDVAATGEDNNDNYGLLLPNDTSGGGGTAPGERSPLLGRRATRSGN